MACRNRISLAVPESAIGEITQDEFRFLEIQFRRMPRDRETGLRLVGQWFDPRVAASDV